MIGPVLIAGMGNIFLGDDAFGVETVRALMRRTLPNHLTVKDFGIRGLDLAYALLEPWDTVIMVDAMRRGQSPGTLTLLEPDPREMGDPARVGLDPHAMDPNQVLNLAASFGPIQAHILVLGCEPSDFGDELEGRMGLSHVLAASVEIAVQMLEEIAVRSLGRQSTFTAVGR
jgi:hydrogenase maturation protease